MLKKLFLILLALSFPGCATIEPTPDLFYDGLRKLTAICFVEEFENTDYRTYHLRYTRKFSFGFDVESSFTAIDGIVAVTIGAHTVALKKSKAYTWHEIEAKTIVVIKAFEEYLETYKPIKKGPDKKGI